MEQALKNTIIATSTEYQLTLKSFFKDEFRYANDCYLIPFSHIKYTKRQIFSYIYDSCGVVCSKINICHGHQFLFFVKLIYRFNRYSIMKKKVFFEYFLFRDFKLTSDQKITLKPIKIKGWKMQPVYRHVIDKNLTYSQRLSYLK